MAMAMGPVSCLPAPASVETAAGGALAASSTHEAAFIQKEVTEIVNNMLSLTINPGTPESKFRSEVLDLCRRVLVENDQGGYTIPAKGLYPYQWNWDSALVSLGLAELDELRAWEELEQLMSAQWQDGMVPHIVFHKPSSTYFPGPEIWGSVDKPRYSTGITQPPVAAISVRRMFEAAKDRNLARIKAEQLFPKLFAWHKWFYEARDPEGTGLVATLHPWETGMDNSPAWDEALARVPVDQIPPYVRRDLGHVDAKMRPQQAEYDRYLTLLYRFRAVDYDLEKLYFQSPFRVTDLCTNCVLHKANEDLLWLGSCIGAEEGVKETIRGWLSKSKSKFDTLFDSKAGLYKSKDQITGELLGASTSAGFLPLFAGVAGEAEAAAVVKTLERWLEKVEFGVPSCDPDSEKFEELRYWRGPVWLIVNWMIVEGLKRYGYEEIAERVERDSLELIKLGGISEYFSPLTGAGAGGSFFSWTAAMCLTWLLK